MELHRDGASAFAQGPWENRIGKTTAEAWQGKEKDGKPLFQTETQNPQLPV